MSKAGFDNVKSTVGVARRCGTSIDKTLRVTAIGTVLLFVIAGLMLSMSRVSAEDPAPTTASVTVTSSCRLVATTDSAHTAEVTASTYQPDIGKTTFTATCNDVNGYDVYAVGYTNTEFGRNDMLGANTGRTIDTGMAVSGDDSAWAMKLTAVSGAVAPTITTGYSAYHAVPDDYVKVASYSGSTMSEPTGSKFETTYATYVASTQVPDTYTGKVKYTLVHPSDAESAPCAATYTINYNNNGGSGTMDSQTACVDRAISVLPNSFTAPVPTSENQFVLWNTAADGSGYSYNARQSVTNIASAGGSVTLYAQWAPKYMQDLTATQCSIFANQAPLTVYDRRDGKDYTVRYLAGACWMTQNLRITGTVNKQYSNFSTYDNVNVCEGDLTVGDSYDEPRCHDSENASNGVWYNYAAASAKTILTSSNYTDATEDICPAGWHLPSYDTNSSAGSLNSIVDLNSAGKAAFSLVTGGYYYGGSKNTGSSQQYWWSSVVSANKTRYALDYSSDLSINSSRNRQNGLYIRCTRETD